MFCFLIVATLFQSLSLGFVYNSAPTSTVLTNLRTDIRALIDASTQGGGPQRPLLATVVRLGFHDCVGAGCDGCINRNNAENNGLGNAIDTLETTYTSKYSSQLSRADYWALAATLSAEYGASLQPGGQPHVPAFQFKWGRQDCGTSPTTTVVHEFPNALGNTTSQTSFFNSQFGLTPKETVALLGAHTLGRATTQNSGFRFPWVQRADVVDNQYFIDLNNANLGWTSGTQGPGTKPQWTRVDGNNRRFLMLNADMALLKNISPVASDGTVSCTYSTCPVSSTAQFVQLYAGDNTQWLDDFALVWDKMLAKGNPTLYTISSSSTLPSGCPATLCQAATTTTTPATTIASSSTTSSATMTTMTTAATTTSSGTMTTGSGTTTAMGSSTTTGNSGQSTMMMTTNACPKVCKSSLSVEVGLQYAMKVKNPTKCSDMGSNSCSSNMFGYIAGLTFPTGVSCFNLSCSDTLGSRRLSQASSTSKTILVTFGMSNGTDVVASTSALVSKIQIDMWVKEMAKSLTTLTLESVAATVKCAPNKCMLTQAQIKTIQDKLTAATNSTGNPSTKTPATSAGSRIGNCVLLCVTVWLMIVV